MGIIKGKIRHEPEGPELLIAKSSAMGLANIFDQRHLACLELGQDMSIERIVSEDMCEKYGFGARRDFLDDLPSIHPEGAWVDVDKYRSEAALEDRRDVGHPGERRHDDLTETKSFFEAGIVNRFADDPEFTNTL